MGKGFDIDSLLRKLKEDMEDNGSRGNKRERTKSDLTETEQAEQLIESMTYFNSKPQFKIGDFVRYRKECHGFIRNAEKLHIVMGAIDPPQSIPMTSETEGGHLNYRVYDTIIGICDPNDKGCILKFAADSRDLEVYPGGDRLKHQGTA